MPLYQSLPHTTNLPKTEHELVIVSPYDLPPEMEGLENVTLIKDRGCPSRCYQLGALHSKGEYIVCSVDDGTFCPNRAIDKAFKILPKHHKGVVTFKYSEHAGGRNAVDMAWNMGAHKTMKKLPYIPNHYLLLPTFLMRRDYFMEVGGWDCKFEQPGVGCIDLAVRFQNDGAEIAMGHKYMDLENDCGSHHSPIERAHWEHDMPLLIKIYSTVPNRSRIPFDNWKNASEVWPRRAV